MIRGKFLLSGDPLCAHVYDIRRRVFVEEQGYPLETEIDVIEEKLQEDLFASDRELAEKLQLSTLYVLFGDISDIIEDIADKIQILLIARKA